MKLKHTLAISGVIIATALVTQYAAHSKDVPPLKPLSGFPTLIDSWAGRTERFDDKIYEVLGVDDSFMATYRNPEGGLVQLYVGFYESQREGELIHSPKNCMPGGGWNIVETSIVPIQLPDREKEIKVIKLTLQKGSERQLVLYWFQSRGRFIASEYLQKIYLVLDSITKNRTDGSFVRLISPMSPKGEDATIKALKEFARGVIPVLEEYLPS
ncbi:MAG: exosortase C-terminal domain/associated protein EpsI [Thermodesulfobacteriota bacterium]